MKKIFIYFVFSLLVVQAGFAQVDRSKYPEPGPAPEIKIGEAETFTLANGLKVFVVENRKLPRVAFSLVLDRDPIFEGDKAGLTGFVGEMMTAGTKNRTKDQLDEEVDFIGASLRASSTSIFGSSLKQHQEKVLELMTDVLYNPVFPAEELEKQKKQALTGLATNKDDPDAISGRLVGAVNFGKNHPYGQVQTEESTKNIQLADIKAYHETFFRPNIAYLAIVGDIDKAEAEKLVKQYFSKWEKKEVPSFDYENPSKPEGINVALVDRSASVQSVINITHPVKMHITNDDYLSTQVLDYILGGGASSRLFMNLREDKGYTYGAYSSIGSDKLITRFSARASVRSEVTDSAVYEMLYEIRNIVDKGVTEEELESAKANLSGSFGRSLESPSTIANFAINTERYGLPADFYATYLQRLNDITVEDVNQAAKKYLNPEGLYITVVGNGSGIKDGLSQFGEIKMYNNMGDPAREVEMANEDITVEEIFEKYIEAIGGRENVEKVETAKITSSAEVQGMKLNLTSIHDEPNRQFAQSVEMMGNVASRTVIKDGKAKVTAMGQSQELNDEQFEAVKMSMFIFPELHYEEMGYTMEVDGVADVEGKDAYKVIIRNPTGSEIVNYYSVEDGLKLRNENPMAGDTTYEEYEEYEGVFFPTVSTMKSPQIPVPLKTVVESLEINTEISEADFN
ncbi:insulinase family protein [Litoribacter ruber]|uniref:M16 family metallopeptidase n=1 Tax=Litoribacter ruber TaxID=702568 RepID=UPI001BD9BD1C|nr:pitrilysin family protein [Litoribacter ruber]MBT0812279.1 insulinase family protein [Litoribacter ruber]